MLPNSGVGINSLTEIPFLMLVDDIATVFKSLTSLTLWAKAVRCLWNVGTEELDTCWR